MDEFDTLMELLMPTARDDLKGLYVKGMDPELDYAIKKAKQQKAYYDKTGRQVKKTRFNRAAYMNDYNTKYYSENKEQIIKTVIKYTQENKQKIRIYKNQHYNKDKDYYNNNRLKSVYRITQQDYDKLNDKQNGLCAICNKSEASGIRLALDHCHDTNKIRGLLCGNHNRGLGYFNHDIGLLQKAIDYLKLHQLE